MAAKAIAAQSPGRCRHHRDAAAIPGDRARGDQPAI